MKTKPTQHAVRALNSAGLQPDIIVCRSTEPLDDRRREKLALHCGIDPAACVSAPDVPSIYVIPELFEKQELGKFILKKLGIRGRAPNITAWRDIGKKIGAACREVNIAMVGKYFATGAFTLADSYLSVIEALKHAGWHDGVKPKLTWIDSGELEKSQAALKELEKYDGIVVPGGFGSRAVNGILSAIRIAREKKIPYLGLCYGMQLACVEIARNCADLGWADTVEINPKTKHPIITMNPNQIKNIETGKMGNSMRLGLYRCALEKGSMALDLYGATEIKERHRHRYEFNNAYREALKKCGVRFSGVNPETDLVEIIELKGHPFFVGVQFHPEFLSRPMQPHPLFVGFIKAITK